MTKVDLNDPREVAKIMTFTVNMPCPDVIRIETQTGAGMSKFYEPWLMIHVDQWEDLKARIDQAVAQRTLLA